MAVASCSRSIWRIPPDVHLQRDVIGAAWDRGLAPLVVERFVVPTPALPLRTWGYVVAARLDEIGQGAWA